MPRLSPELSSRPFDVLLAGQGAPAQGGIPRFLDAVRNSGLSTSFRLDYLNLMRGPVFDAGHLTLANVARACSDAWALWHRAKRARLVHINSATVPLVTLVRTGLLCAAARLAGARVILHVHSGLVELWLKDHPRRLLARALLWPAHMLVAASEGSRGALASTLRGKRIVLVDNGIDVSVFRPRDDGRKRPVVASAGFLTPRKGTGDLLDASRLLRERGVDHELILAGDPIPEAGGLQLETLRAGAQEHVRFLGYVPPDAMPDFYAGSDVFCLASWWEAMPISVLEAMAAGLPVVATKVGDIPRAVGDGVTGLLVPPRRVDLLTDALERLLVDGEERVAMGRAGRRRVQEMFSLRSTTDALEGLYRQALG